jgi:cellulose synthase/poly-beta-1,6-N-acetylglucosamine synthase-like glycosyltransferase
VVIVKALFWGSLAGLAWTHVGYPVAAAGLLRLRRREIDKQDITPTVPLIVPAHDEEDVIGARVENLLEFDYPSDRLQLVVASDGSTERTHEIVQSFDGQVRLLECERGGKLPTMNAAVRETQSEILAFGDANATRAPDALRKLVRSFADPGSPTSAATTS